MGTISPSIPTIGDPNSTEDPDIRSALITIRDVINGALDNDNIASAAGIVYSKLLLTNSIVNNDIATNAAIALSKIEDNGLLEDVGVNETGIVRRGKSIIATEETRTNTAFGTLTTPDQVASIVLPTDGLIFAVYQALWKEAGAGDGVAAFFLGSNQVKEPRDATAPAGAEAVCDDTTYSWLHSTGGGLKPQSTVTGNATGGVTTGLVIALDDNDPAICPIWAAAGTYTLSVQFKSTGAGSVTAKERKLWAWTMGF